MFTCLKKLDLKNKFLLKILFCFLDAKMSKLQKRLYSRTFKSGFTNIENTNEVICVIVVLCCLWTEDNRKLAGSKSFCKSEDSSHFNSLKKTKDEGVLSYNYFI